MHSPGRDDDRSRSRPSRTRSSSSQRRHHQGDLDRDLRLRPAPLRGAGAVPAPRRRARPRDDGRRARRSARRSRDLKVGDRVVVPFNISCGHCWMCSRGLFAQCETTQNREDRQGRFAVRLHRAVRLGPRRPGGVPSGARRRSSGRSRCPKASRTSATSTSPTSCPTAWQAFEFADVPEDGTVAVFGLGPVGQLTLASR